MNEIGMRLPNVDALTSLSSKLPKEVTSAEAGTAARQFQELLGALLVKEMRTTLPEGFFGSGAGGDVYGAWLDEHVGAALAKRDALHLEGFVRESLDRKSRSSEVLP
jgi:Rod binding domain-containing protein